MRIVENTSARVVLRDRTLWISWLCFAAGATVAVWTVAARHDPRALITAGLFLAFGVGFLRSSDVVFDRGQRICTVRRRDIGRVTRTVVAFDDITDIRVEPMPVGDNGGGIACRLSLVTASGTLPFSASYQPSYPAFIAMRETLADVVFEGRAKPAAADPVRTLIAAGRGVDAVTWLRVREGLDLATAHSRVQAMRRAEGL